MKPQDGGIALELLILTEDGDMDFIGGNLGLNSMLKASANEPVEMYLNDFDNNGILDQVICSYQEWDKLSFCLTR